MVSNNMLELLDLPPELRCIIYAAVTSGPTTGLSRYVDIADLLMLLDLNRSIRDEVIRLPELCALGQVATYVRDVGALHHLMRKYLQTACHGQDHAAAALCSSILATRTVAIALSGADHSQLERMLETVTFYLTRAVKLELHVRSDRVRRCGELAKHLIQSRTIRTLRPETLVIRDVTLESGRGSFSNDAEVKCCKRIASLFTKYYHESAQQDLEKANKDLATTVRFRAKIRVPSEMADRIMRSLGTNVPLMARSLEAWKRQGLIE